MAEVTVVPGTEVDFDNVIDPFRLRFEDEEEGWDSGSEDKWEEESDEEDDDWDEDEEDDDWEEDEDDWEEEEEDWEEAEDEEAF